MSHTAYTELTPTEFRQRIADAPIAYLPLGTLEWHGEHLPLGADGLQSEGFFYRLADRVGGIVLPMLFLGPDRVKKVGDEDLYGMDYCSFPTDDPGYYTERRLTGSAYWVDGALFDSILEATVRQLKRAGFRIVVAHGHGPSTSAFDRQIERYRHEFGLTCYTCQNETDADGTGLMCDHAAMNETSIVMALRPDLVRMENLPEDLTARPIGLWGKDPRGSANPEFGASVLSLNLDRMERILRNALDEVRQ